MSWLPAAPFLLLGGFVVWLMLRPQYAFVVQIRDGAAHLRQGKVTDAFLKDLADVCRRANVDAGTVKGVRKGRRIALVFSRRIPPGCQQQIRNLWVVSS